MNQTYSFMDFTALEEKALTDRKSYLEQQKRKFESVIYGYKDNKEWGKDSLDEAKIKYEDMKNQISMLEEKLRNLQQLSYRDVLDTKMLRVNNFVYSFRNHRINKLEEKMDSHEQALQTMADGKVKDKVMRKYKKMEKKLEKLKNKNIKLGDKQIDKIFEREMVRDKKKKKESRLVAEAKVYGNQAIAARNASNMQGISKLEKANYQRQEKKYKKKHKKAYNKLQKLRNSNVRVRSANPITMARNAINRFRQANRQQQNTQRHP